MIEWIALAGAAYGIYNWLTGDSDSEKGSDSSSSRGGSGGSNYFVGSGSSVNFGGYNFRFAGAIEINPYEEYSYADYEVGGPRNEYGNKRYCTVLTSWTPKLIRCVSLGALRRCGIYRQNK